MSLEARRNYQRKLVELHRMGFVKLVIVLFWGKNLFW